MLHPYLRITSFVFFVGACAASLWAQPSGGPYGPQDQTYEVPAQGRVIYVAPTGKTDAPGATLEEPTTIEQAIERCESGDVLVLRGGLYRTGNLVLNQGVTLQPYRNEKPVFKGTEVVTAWEGFKNGVWRARWKTLFPMKPQSWWRREHEGVRTPLHKFNNDMVFKDGVSLQSAGWEGELDENRFTIDYDAGYVYIHFDPKGHVIEMTTHDAALVRTVADVHGKKSDKKGYTLKGLTFTQYAYRALEIEGRDPEGPESEDKFGKDVIGSTIEDCTLTFCSRVGGYFRGDHFVMRRCYVSDTSTEGVFLLASNDCLFEKNIFTRNNVEHITGYYPAAVKIFNQTHRVIFRDNVIIDQADSEGVWYDVGNVGGVIVNNWIEGCFDGFMYEISRDALCAGNVFVNCDKGLRSLNSAGVRAYHNTFYNTVASFERNERSAVGDHFDWHPATGPGVDQRDHHEFSYNLVMASRDFPKALLRTEQSAALNEKIKQSSLQACDGNLYVRSDEPARALYQWAPGIPTKDNAADVDTLETLKKLFPAFETTSLLLPIEPSSFVRSPVLHRFEPIKDSGLRSKVTPELSSVLGWNFQEAVPGAYQTR